MTNADVSIVIVNYNNGKYLINCLKSIYQNTQNVNFSTVIVDNASTDNSVELIQALFPKVRIIQNDTNLGFAKANNVALRQLQTKYALILNPDTLVVNNSIEKMFNFMEQHPEVSIVGPKILNPDYSFQHTGITFPNNLNLLFETFFLERIFPNSRLFGKHKKIYEPFTKTKRVDYLQGSCLMIRKQILEDVAFFDERYFMYFEETDLCYRAKKMHWQVFRLGDAEVIHFGGGETGYYDEFRICQYHKSLILFFLKHHKRIDIFFLRIVVFVRLVIRVGLFSLLYLLINDKKKYLSQIKGYIRVLSLIFS